MRRYGAIAGVTEGKPEVKKRCVVEVRRKTIAPNGRYNRWYGQCTKHRKHGPNGELCLQHDNLRKAGRRLSIPEDGKGI